MTEVQLFSTCLAEEFFPEVGAAATTVLERLRLKVRPLKGAFCCGQVAFNEGLRDEAVDLARRFLSACKPDTPIVVPSGSCSSMLRIFYTDLLAHDTALAERAAAVRPWIYEFSQFIVGVMKVKYVGARFERAVAYHPSCHLMRELRVREEPMALLSAVNGIRLVEVRDREECCGFGGLFSVKFPHISGAMLEDKLARIRESGAQVVVANDCGCLMQIGGGLRRAGAGIEVRHLVEILAAR
ncbi:MAG TPA: (Fe-S)-binding protein [Candidatus Binataceae bacterium]|nr:(Fe-S)-binding protein [Candidatus Binataceae bacterium]